MQEGYGSRSVCVCVCICLSVTTLAAAYLVYTLKARCHRIFYGVFKVFVVWLSLKTLCSKVLVSFADHHCLLYSVTSSQWTKETALAYFQLEECVQLMTAPITRLTCHWS